MHARDVDIIDAVGNGVYGVHFFYRRVADAGKEDRYEKKGGEQFCFNGKSKVHKVCKVGDFLKANEAESYKLIHLYTPPRDISFKPALKDSRAR